MSQEVATQDMFDENILVLSSYESSWRDDPLNAMIKQRDSEENVERQALKTARKEGSKQEKLGYPGIAMTDHMAFGDDRTPPLKDYYHIEKSQEEAVGYLDETALETPKQYLEAAPAVHNQKVSMTSYLGFDEDRTLLIKDYYHIEKSQEEVIKKRRRLQDKARAKCQLGQEMIGQLVQMFKDEKPAFEIREVQEKIQKYKRHFQQFLEETDQFMMAHNDQEAAQNVAKLYHIFRQEQEQVEKLLTSYYDQMKYQDSASDEEEVAHKAMGASMATEATQQESNFKGKLGPGENVMPGENDTRGAYSETHSGKEEPEVKNYNEKKAECDLDTWEEPMWTPPEKPTITSYHSLTGPGPALQLIPVLVKKDTSGDSKELVGRLDSGTKVTYINVNPGQKSALSSVDDGAVMKPFKDRETMDGNKQEEDQGVLNVNPGQKSALSSVDDGAVMKPFKERETMDGNKQEEDQGVLNVNPGQKSALSSVDDGAVMKPFNERETMDGKKQEDEQGVLNVNPGQMSAQSVEDRAVQEDEQGVLNVNPGQMSAQSVEDRAVQEDDQGVLNGNPGQMSAQSVEDGVVPFKEREKMDGSKKEEEQQGSTGQKILRKGTQDTNVKGVENRIMKGHIKEVEGFKPTNGNNKPFPVMTKGTTTPCQDCYDCSPKPQGLSLNDTRLSGQRPEMPIHGLVWDPGLGIKPLDDEQIKKKREPLSTWLFKSRNLLQRLWLTGKEWDSAVPEDIQIITPQWASNIRSINGT
jgi:hypothetical protein